MKLVSILLFLLSLNVNATTFSFFDNEIEYWPKEEILINTQKFKIVNKVVKKERDNNQPFDWKLASDPTKDEFYMEGKHTPPPALVAVMKNPTSRNIKKYYAREEKRKQHLEKFINKSSRYRLSKVDGVLKTLEAPKINKKSFYKGRELRSKYRLRMYYDTNCPHCLRMYDVFQHLQNEGFSVDSVQIDDNKESFTKIKTRPLRPGEGKLVGLFSGGTPYILILNIQTNKIKSLRGFANYSKLMMSMN